jgi:hypothetical protein
MTVNHSPSPEAVASDPSAGLPGAEAGPERPWYHDGLSFACTRCGACCTGQPGFVWVDDQEIAAIAALLDKPVGEIRLLHTRPARGRISLTEFPNGDCTFFDPKTRSCCIYDARPQQCRTWPFWRSNVCEPVAWDATRRTCPGAGHGQLYPAEEIERLVRLTDRSES